MNFDKVGFAVSKDKEVFLVEYNEEGKIENSLNITSNFVETVITAFLTPTGEESIFETPSGKRVSVGVKILEEKKEKKKKIITN